MNKQEATRLAADINAADVWSLRAVEVTADHSGCALCAERCPDPAGHIVVVHDSLLGAKRYYLHHREVVANFIRDFT